MRKVSLIILAILLCLVVSALAESPAPFQRAKEMALQAPMTYRGFYLINMTVSKNG